MTSIPFCVIEKPYMIWAADVRADNEHFLKRLDADLYYRMAHNIIGAPQPDEEAEDAETDEDGDDQDRKDVSTLSRLLWHHGMETLVMLLGAYIQAPSAVHAYFLKSKTEDAVQMAGFLAREECLKYHRLCPSSECQLTQFRCSEPNKYETAHQKPLHDILCRDTLRGLAIRPTRKGAH